MEQTTQDPTETEEQEFPLHWQRAFGTTDPQAVLCAFDEIRAKVGPLSWADSTEIIREDRERGLPRA